MSRPESSSEVPDEVLARRVQNGDRRSFEELVRRYLRRIHAVAATHLPDPDEVEDVAQDAFLRALENIRRFDPDRPFAPWLYQIARNVARNRRKTRSRRRAVPLADVDGTRASSDPDPHRDAEREEVRRRVREAMETLPAAQREAFRLFDVEGLRAAEVAEILDVSEGTVRSNVYHARRALRARLSDLAGDG